MDLRHHQLPWSEQIWAKINADLTQALAQSRRVRAPFEVFHVPDATQIVLADRVDANGDLTYAETESTPVIELWAPFKIQPSQVFNEGDNFYALDRIIDAAFVLGAAEDQMLIRPSAWPLAGNPARRTEAAGYWYELDYDTPSPIDFTPVVKDYNNDPGTDIPAGIQLFQAVVEAREQLRGAARYEPYAIILSNWLEGQLSTTIPGRLSLTLPMERLKPLVTAGVHTTPTLDDKEAILVSVARSWVDIAQAMEPSIQFLRIDEDGAYHLRLIERFAFRLKDPRARIKIKMNEVPSGTLGTP